MGRRKSQVPEEWVQNLTPQRRAKFEGKGTAIVEAELLGIRYRSLEKRLAALAWLAEQRHENELAEKARFWTPVAISAVSLCIAAWAVAVTKGWL